MIHHVKDDHLDHLEAHGWRVTVEEYRQMLALWDKHHPPPMVKVLSEKPKPKEKRRELVLYDASPGPCPDGGERIP